MGLIEVFQGNSNPTPDSSHEIGTTGEYAYDFDLKAGDDVLAARGGEVVKVQDGNTECGLSNYCLDKANYVIIKHKDDTFAEYGHLQIGVLDFVQEGVTVVQGQIIGKVGNTGYTSCKITAGGGYHLHFQVQEIPVFGAQSAEVCFSDVEGGVPMVGTSYVSTQVAVVQGGSSVTPEVRVESIEISSTETPKPPTATPEPPSATPEPVLVEVFQFDPINETVSGSVPLEQGTKYLVTIYGTMSWWAAAQWPDDSFCGTAPDSQPQIPSPGKFNGPAGTDFAFYFSDPFWTDSCEKGLEYPLESGSTKFSLDNGASLVNLRPIDNEFSGSHTYRYTLIGQGAPLLIRLGDSYYPDNYGQFSITVEQN
jgi:hypothetical protein